MKKFLLVFVFAAFVAGAAFADHPGNKWGIGLMGGYNINFGSAVNTGQASLSLKVPNMPVFWAVSAQLDSNYWYLALSGDYYLVNGVLIPDINLHYFLGLGFYGQLGYANDLSFALGARLPIGLSWHVVDFLEIFLNISPSLGLGIIPDFHFPVGGVPLEIGIRVWL
jgi:hypothetical protein